METDPRSVMVVHGRDPKARNAMFEFLRALQLKPLEWSVMVAQARKVSPYIGDVVGKAFEKAQAVVILFTPDDQARLRPDLCQGIDEIQETQWIGQARQNVLIEAGMALSRCPERTILAQLGMARPASDLAGMHVIMLNNEASCRHELATRLEGAGCLVDQSGTDWLRAGNFSPPDVEMGIISAREHLPFKQFFSSMGAAQRRVIIFQMWMTIDKEGYNKAFDNISKNNECEIMILLLKPDSDLAVQRSRDLKLSRDGNYYADEFVKDQISENVRFFTSVANKYKVEKLEIRYFEAIAPFQLYLVDNTAFVGFYTKNQRATNALQLELDGSPLEDTLFGKFVLDEFRKVWEAATPAYPNPA